MSSQNQTPDVVIPQIKRSCTEGTEAFPVATDGNGSQESDETTGLSLSLNPAEPLTPISIDQTEKQSKGIAGQCATYW